MQKAEIAIKSKLFSLGAKFSIFAKNAPLLTNMI